MDRKSALPTLVFLSGGTALDQVSSHIGYNHALYLLRQSRQYDCFNVIYVITCFDSGGSSGILRNWLPLLPAVGDIRNRICSVAQGMFDAFQEMNPTRTVPLTVPWNSTLFVHLCKHRFPNQSECFEMNLLSQDLYFVLCSFTKHLLSSDTDILASSSSSSQILLSYLIRLIQGLPNDLCRSCGLLLKSFLDEMTSNSSEFCFYGACIGNLILTGAYLQQKHDLRAAINVFIELLGICPRTQEDTLSPSTQIFPASTDHLTLGAHLRSGKIILGQHAITGVKGKTRGLDSPIQSIFLIDYQPNTFTPSPSSIVSAPPAAVIEPPERFALATPEAMASIQSASIICYSVGSFFTSLLASIMPTGISASIRQNVTAPKIFVPNMRLDSEMLGLSLFDATEFLLQTLFKYDFISSAGDALVESPQIPFLASNYLSVILLDRHSLSLALSSPSPQESDSSSNNSHLPYAHFGSSQEIAESIHRIQTEFGIPVRVEDLCRFSEKTQIPEIDPEKLLKIFREL
jgi:2-phospho-L-lactate transferase/gluconeogenesis factor (CofD/UPF0052 family)